MIREVNKLIAKAELEEAAKLVNYNSPKLDEYIKMSNDLNKAQYYEKMLNLFTEVAKEIQKLAK